MKIANKVRLMLAGTVLLAAAVSATADDSGIIIPGNVPRGSRIALITPATATDSIPVVKAANRLRALGYEPVTYPHTFGKHHGSYSATDAERIADIEAAFADTTIAAIMCTRGGFGSTHMLPSIDTALIKRNPKWLIGYSDVSAIHALLFQAGVASLHAPMAGHLADEPADDQAVAYLVQLIRNGLPMTYNVPSNKYNSFGKAEGRLLGGNLVVLDDLSQTPWDMFAETKNQPVILFIEDVSEKIHAVERVLLRLHHSGILEAAEGIIIGRFTDYKPDDDFYRMDDMIYTRLKQWGYIGRKPVAFNFPVGHITSNYPLVEGAMTALTVAPDGTTLTMGIDLMPSAAVIEEAVEVVTETVPKPQPTVEPQPEPAPEPVAAPEPDPAPRRISSLHGGLHKK